MDENITLLDLLHVICTDIMNEEDYNVMKTTKVDNISNLKKEHF